MKAPDVLYRGKLLPKVNKMFELKRSEHVYQLIFLKKKTEHRASIKCHLQKYLSICLDTKLLFESEIRLHWCRVTSCTAVILMENKITIKFVTEQSCEWRWEAEETERKGWPRGSVG